MRSGMRPTLVGLAALSAFFVLAAGVVCAQEYPDLLTGLTRVVSGHKVGPDYFAVKETETIQNSYGVSFQRVEAHVSGAIEGWTTLTGMRHEQVADYPEIVLAGRGNFEKRLWCVARYEAPVGDQPGHTLTFLYPVSPKDWSGKIYYLEHGLGAWGKLGPVKVAGTADRLNPDLRAFFASLMIDKGYAVIFSSRGSSGTSGEGPIKAVLADGRVLDNRAIGNHAGLVRDLALVGKRFLESRLGRKAERMYHYGKSHGANTGRVLNYGPGANLDYDGKILFDGFLNDDAGGGLFPPIMVVDGKDVLFAGEQDKKNFVPQIDVSHQIYVGEGFLQGTYWGSYCEVKRDNQRILNAKGLGGKSRTYELVGVSHSDTGGQWLRTADSLKCSPEIAGFMDAMIDILDRWADRGIKPPPTRSDAYDLGDVDGDGIIENPAIELPEIAAPTGVYYLYPQGEEGSGTLGFAAYLKEEKPIWNATAAGTFKGDQTRPEGFEDIWLEPLNHYKWPVDMNKNGARDTRESISKAWQRRAIEGYKTGILARGETLTHAKYVSEVARVAANLYEQGFISARALFTYIDAAMRSDVGK